MVCRPAVCSHSLGRAWVHSLTAKLDAAAAHGMDIELFYEDLHTMAAALPGGATDANQLRAASQIRALADARGIRILSLQPFAQYEGLRDRDIHARRVDEMRLWIRLARMLGTDLISIAATFLPGEQSSGDWDLIVADLREIADLGAADGIHFAYEALCWSTHVDTWERSWEVVVAVDRENFGICLDTFNIAGRVYADPAMRNGKTPFAEEEMRQSLERMVRAVDVRKVAYVQCVDAESLAAPLIIGHELYDRAQPARMSWSRNCRLFYGERDRGAYLPIQPILRAIIVDLGFDGYISAEVFSRDLVDPRPEAPEELAWRAAVSWQKIVDDFKLVEEPPVAAVTPAPRAQL